jgi:hypothetical protein
MNLHDDIKRTCSQLRDGMDEMTLDRLTELSRQYDESQGFPARSPSWSAKHINMPR